MELSLTLDDRAVRKRFATIGEGIKDFRAPLSRAGDDLLDFFGEDVFKSQGRKVGPVWRRLAESTLMAREMRRGYYSQAPEVEGKILWWTGRLKRGFEKEVKKDMLRIYNDVDYFKYHQESGGGQRKMLAINSRVIEIVVDRVAQYTFSLLK